MFHEVATLVHLIESSKPEARGGHPLDRAAGGALTPRGATMLRERSYRQLVARQSRPRQDLVMRGAFCDQPWPGNDAGDGPGLSRTVGVAIRGAHGSYRAPARCSALSGFCLHFAIFFAVFCRGGKN